MDLSSYENLEGIYAYQNKVNNNIYVGHTHNFKHRAYLHNSRFGAAPALVHAITLYGLSSFRYFILCLMPGSTRAEREVIERSYFDTLHCPYNIHAPGSTHPNAEGWPENFVSSFYVPVTIQTLSGSTIISFPTVKAASNWLGVGVNTVYSYLERGKALGGMFRVIPFIGGESMPEADVDRLQGEFLNYWKNFGGKKLGAAVSKSIQGKAVEVSSLDGNVLGTYPSINDAARAHNIKPATLRISLSRQSPNICGGLLFKKL
uniref:GIY-YIG endonuclease n=1 Tax=Powellomyces hirtus TaxID=109895 RepID=A0A4P8NQT9_9FUNG|nr:GIY-YIG endonuclease [Powellomyces hirtus]